MPKSTKIYSKLVVVVKIATVVTFVWILFSQQKNIQKIDFKSIDDFKWSLFLLVVGLIPLNWYYEYLKWKITLKSLQCYSFKISVHSFLSGIFSGFITPNFIGNFIGRVLYFPFKTRPKIVLFTLLASYSQFLTTLTIGAITLYLFPIETTFFPSQYHWVIYLFLVIGWLIYFLYEYLPIQKTKRFSFLKHLNLGQSTLSLKLKYILYNVMRYAIFSIQYLLLLNVFSSGFNMHLYSYITLIYFWSTLIPNFIWGKLFLRETIALVILLPIIPNANILLIASFSLSVMNQIIPAVVGIPFLVKKKKYE